MELWWNVVLALLGVLVPTAFTPVLTEAADLYRKSCPGASFRLDTRGSVEGLRRLNEMGRHSAESSQILAFSDGEKPDGYPDSGTRTAFQKRILAGATEYGSNFGDCLRLAPGVRCERASTSELLDAVTQTPGAIGYSEVGAAVQRKDLHVIRIGGRRATLSEADGGAYPFWETELAYSYGDPAVGSLAAGFLRYLRDDVGRDIVRSSGDRPCAELQNPVLCRPV